MIKLLFARLFELGLNKILPLNPNYIKILKKHQGDVIKLELTDIHNDFYFVFSQEKIYVYSTYTAQPTTILSGNSINFLKQLRSDETALSIEGDIELAHDLQCLLKGLDINIEESIAFLLGDFTTQQLSQSVKEIKESTQHITKRTIEDFCDYLQEEKRFLPTQEEVEDFYEEVGILRYDIERLEARLNRLWEKNKK